MRRFAPSFVTLVAATMGVTCASAAMHPGADPGTLMLDPPSTASTLDTVQEDLADLLRREDVEPNSNKARIIAAWVQKIRHDPVIEAGIPGGTQRVAAIFLDPVARADFMSRGIARLAPSDRLTYVQLLTKFLDELVPVNCFGLSDMSAVMNRISLREMTDADVDAYFSLLHKVMLSDASNASVSMPTSQQYADAERQLTRSLIAELHGDENNIERFVFYTSNPSKATPTDMCWTTRVTLHAIIAMPEPERDLVLLRTVMPRTGQNAASDGQVAAPNTLRPAPASSPPGSVDAP